MVLYCLHIDDSEVLVWGRHSGVHSALTILLNIFENNSMKGNSRGAE